jgi:DNA polymerase/3'-5' exonuclease PolX
MSAVAQAKTKYPREVACAVAREICAAMKPVCDRLIVAGSLRRRKQEVGDVEILFIPSFGRVLSEGELFPTPRGNLADDMILSLVSFNMLQPRLNVNGGTAMGPQNKLMVHVATGVPVDLFTATDHNWWSYLVCRTGGKMSNTQLAARAQEQGYKWHPYRGCFERRSDGAITRIESERHAFEFVGLAYQEPCERA